MLLLSAKASVYGAKQVSGAIFASTLTTICVFLPIVFADGITVLSYFSSWWYTRFL